MQYSHKYLHQELSRLPGIYKELFLETQSSIGLQIVNGRTEPVSRSESSGSSLLLTSSHSKQFDARESLEHLSTLFVQ